MKSNKKPAANSTLDKLIVVVLAFNLALLLVEAWRHPEHSFLGMVVTAIALSVLVARQR